MKPFLPRPFEVPLQHVARVAVERLARVHLDVAEHAGDGGVGIVAREQLERVGIGPGEHVGLLDPAVALDRGSVEGHALLEGGLQLGRRDLDRLEKAQHVGEPQPDESDAPLLHRPQDVLVLALHYMAPSSSAQCAVRAGPKLRFVRTI